MMRQIKKCIQCHPAHKSGRQCPVFISQTAPVSRLRCGLQQLQLPVIRKHVLVLHQQAIHTQLREQLDQLRR